MEDKEIEKIKENQQVILQTLNNGLKTQVKSNGKGLEKMEERFNKLLLAIGAGMFAIIIMLVQIMISVG